VCGVDFYGPCLPADTAPTQNTPFPKPSAATPSELFTPTAFDDYGLASGDPMIVSFLKAQVSDQGAGRIQAASAEPDLQPDKDTLAASLPYRLSAAPEKVDLDPAALWPGTQIDPIYARSLPEPESRTLVKVIPPRSTIGRLNWMSLRSSHSKRYGKVEEAANNMDTLWDGQQERAAWDPEVLQEHALRENYNLRPKGR